MDITETAFMLILNAGNARNNAKEAEQFASDYEFERAEEAIKKAKDELAKETSERPAARALFKYIKSELQRSGAAIPDELAKPYVNNEGDK